MNGLSGFAWNPLTEMMEAEEEVWQQLIQANPGAAELRNKRIRNYDSLVELYGKDRATGAYSEGQSDIRRRVVNNLRKRGSPIVEESNNGVNEDGVDYMNLNAFEFEDDSHGPPTPTSRSQAQSTASGLRNKRANTVVSDSDPSLEVLERLGQTLATAISSWNKPPVARTELLELLIPLGLPPHMEEKDFMTLSKNRELLNMFLSYPAERRKVLVLRHVFGED